MHLIAPIVLALGLSGALYKTQEVWPYVEYQVMQDKPYFAGRIYAVGGRTKYLAALAEKKKADAEESKAKAKTSASGGGGSV